MSVPERNERTRQPVFNNIPSSILLLAGAIVAVHAMGAVSGPIRFWLETAFVFVSTGAGIAPPEQPLGSTAPYLLHVFIHFGLFHLAMNVAILISAGSAVAQSFGRGARGLAGFLVFFFACSAAGAIAQDLIHSGDLSIMGGASTGVSGLIVAAGWVRGGYRGMLSLALPWIGINLVIALANVAMPIPIGWAAHIGGAIAGALLYPILIGVFGNSRSGER